MHYRLFVTLDAKGHKILNSEDARNKVYGMLHNDDSFCGEGGRFGSPVCDWFVIGGRWSGELPTVLIGHEKISKSANKILKEDGNGLGYSMKNIENGLVLSLYSHFHKYRKTKKGLYTQTISK